MNFKEIVLSPKQALKLLLREKNKTDVRYYFKTSLPYYIKLHGGRRKPDKTRGAMGLS
jgi:hypothetical protein